MPLTKDNETKMRFVEQSMRELHTDLNTWFASLPMSIIAHFGNVVLTTNMPFDEFNKRLDEIHTKFRADSLEQKMHTFKWLNHVMKNGIN